jgi:hypothetical protein
MGDDAQVKPADINTLLSSIETRPFKQEFWSTVADSIAREHTRYRTLEASLTPTQDQLGKQFAI